MCWFSSTLQLLASHEQFMSALERAVLEDTQLCTVAGKVITLARSIPAMRDDVFIRALETRHPPLVTNPGTEQSYIADHVFAHVYSDTGGAAVILLLRSLRVSARVEGVKLSNLLELGVPMRTLSMDLCYASPSECLVHFFQQNHAAMTLYYHLSQLDFLRSAGLLQRNNERFTSILPTETNTLRNLVLLQVRCEDIQCDWMMCDVHMVRGKIVVTCGDLFTNDVTMRDGTTWHLVAVSTWRPGHFYASVRTGASVFTYNDNSVDSKHNVNKDTPAIALFRRGGAPIRIEVPPAVTRTPRSPRKREFAHVVDPTPAAFDYVLASEVSAVPPVIRARAAASLTSSTPSLASEVSALLHVLTRHELLMTAVTVASAHPIVAKLMHTQACKVGLDGYVDVPRHQLVPTHSVNEVDRAGATLMLVMRFMRDDTILSKQPPLLVAELRPPASHNPLKPLRSMQFLADSASVLRECFSQLDFARVAKLHTTGNSGAAPYAVITTSTSLQTAVAHVTFDGYLLCDVSEASLDGMGDEISCNAGAVTARVVAIAARHRRTRSFVSFVWRTRWILRPGSVVITAKIDECVREYEPYLLLLERTVE